MYAHICALIYIYIYIYIYIHSHTLIYILGSHHGIRSSRLQHHYRQVQTPAITFTFRLIPLGKLCTPLFIPVVG